MDVHVTKDAGTLGTRSCTSHEVNDKGGGDGEAAREGIAGTEASARVLFAGESAPADLYVIEGSGEFGGGREDATGKNHSVVSIANSFRRGEVVFRDDRVKGEGLL